MKKWEVGRYELWKTGILVFAESAAEAVEAAFAGRGEEHWKPEFVEIAENYGVSVEDESLPEGVIEALRETGFAVNYEADGYISSLAGVRELYEISSDAWRLGTGELEVGSCWDGKIVTWGGDVVVDLTPCLDWQVMFGLACDQVRKRNHADFGELAAKWPDGAIRPQS